MMHSEEIIDDLLDQVAALKAERDALQGAIDGIYIYSNDTLSGRTDGPDDRDWQRAGVIEIRNRARKFAAVAYAVAARAAIEKAHNIGGDK